MSDLPPNSLPLRRCRAIVVGAAGTVGDLCARALAGHGLELILADIDRMMVNRLAAELGGTAHGLDVLAEASVRQFMRTIDGRPRCGNILVNAAGAGAVRTLGMTRLTRGFAKQVRSGPMTVINIASPGPRLTSSPQPGSELAFHGTSEALTDLIKRPDLQILTFGIKDPPSVVIDALRQWRAICAGTQLTSVNNGLALAAGAKQ